jgi:hypothetical protein
MRCTVSNNYESLLSTRFDEGATHVDKTNVAENWLSDDQVSPMNIGGNGPVTRNEVLHFDRH